MNPSSGAELVGIGRHGFLIGQLPLIVVVVAYGGVNEVKAEDEEVGRVEVVLDEAPGRVPGHIGPSPAGERSHSGLWVRFSEGDAVGVADEGPDEVNRVEVG